LWRCHSGPRTLMVEGSAEKKNEPRVWLGARTYIFSRRLLLGGIPGHGRIGVHHARAVGHSRSHRSGGIRAGCSALLLTSRQRENSGHHQNRLHCDSLRVGGAYGFLNGSNGRATYARRKYLRLGRCQGEKICRTGNGMSPTRLCCRGTMTKPMKPQILDSSTHSPRIL
jgi:hypothetical protein